MQTGVRGAQRPAPGNVTGMTFYKQQREQEAKKRAEAQTADLAEIRQDARRAGYQQGFEEGAAWAFELLANAGVDVDAVLTLDDEPEPESEPEIAAF